MAMQERRPIKICYYVSGHGFGHATRVAQLTSSLLALHAEVTICTLAPRHLFPVHQSLRYRSRVVDSHIVQPLPYDIDVLATFQDLQHFMGRDSHALQDWKAAEEAFVRDGKFDMILADAPWSIGLLQITAPRILVSNFTFDLIFQDLSRYLPHDIDDHVRNGYQNMVTRVIAAYQAFTHLIRLPGYIDFPFLHEGGNTTAVLDAPLVFRPSIKSRDAVLEMLDIPKAYRNHKILLVQFGGHLVSATDLAPQIPEDWICLLATPVPHARFFSFDPSIYLPDLVAASDAVLGKIGYGTVSECVGMAKPLLYVARPMFAEEPYLLRYMADNGTCLELDRLAFERGEWSPAIESVYALAMREKRMLLQDGSEALAKIILDLVA